MPAEDLMREHGVLRRVMYLYDERRCDSTRSARSPSTRSHRAPGWLVVAGGILGAVVSYS